VGCDFLHLINPSTPGLAGDAGSAYESWGFGKSALGVWAPEALRFYVDQRLADGSDGVPRPQASGQDLQRMGGNIFLDNQGTIAFLHYSQTSQDRPSVEQLLALARSSRASQVSRASGSVWLWRKVQRWWELLGSLIQRWSRPVQCKS